VFTGIPNVSDGLDQEKKVEVVDFKPLAFMVQEGVEYFMNELLAIFILYKSFVSGVSPKQDGL